MKYKHFIFDMDGTICESRSVISAQMAVQLTILKKAGYKVVVTSGQGRESMQKQLDHFEPTYLLPQSGADSSFWKYKMNERDEVEVYRHIKKIQKAFREYDWGGGVASDHGIFVEHRGSQIAFSLTGHNCAVELKKKFDPDGRRRKIILEEIPFFSLNIDCKIAGTTCFDYTHKDYSKGRNIDRLINHLGWLKGECIYFGDKLQKGGNDESVIEVIDCVQVDGPEDCISKLLQMTLDL